MSLSSRKNRRVVCPSATADRSGVGPGAASPGPWLLRAIEAGDIPSRGPTVPRRRVASQRVPGRPPPTPPRVDRPPRGGALPPIAHAVKLEQIGRARYSYGGPRDDH